MDTRIFFQTPSNIPDLNAQQARHTELMVPIGYVNTLFHFFMNHMGTNLAESEMTLQQLNHIPYYSRDALKLFWNEQEEKIHAYDAVAEQLHLMWTNLNYQSLKLKKTKPYSMRKLITQLLKTPMWLTHPMRNTITLKAGLDFYHEGDPEMTSNVISNVLLNSLDPSSAHLGKVVVSLDTKSDPNYHQVNIMSMGSAIAGDEDDHMLHPYLVPSQHKHTIALAYSRKVMHRYGGILRIAKNDKDYTHSTLYFPKGV